MRRQEPRYTNLLESGFQRDACSQACTKPAWRARGALVAAEVGSFRSLPSPLPFFSGSTL
jgi:hypothetical protein